MTAWICSPAGQRALVTGGLVFVALVTIHVLGLSPAGWRSVALTAVICGVSATVAELVVKRR